MLSLFTISGIVQMGAKRGKSFGFPTANVQLQQSIPDGIYASDVQIDGQTYQAATFIGAAEMFGETKPKAETYILDFDQDIYGKEITIKLYKKVRGNEKFISNEALIKQIKQDVKDIKIFLQTTT